MGNGTHHRRRPPANNASLRVFYNHWHPAWPLGAFTRYGRPSPTNQMAVIDFLRLTEVIERLWQPVPPEAHATAPSTRLAALYAVAIGGYDYTTIPMWHMSGLSFDQYFKKTNERMRHVQGALSPAGFVRTLIESKAPRDLHLFKLDFDGFECDVLEAMLSAGFRPRVIIVEASPAWPPPYVWRIHYHPAWWYGAGGRFFYGCSLQALVNLLRPRGYVLVQYLMEDAWFARASEAATLGANPLSSVRLTCEDALRAAPPSRN